MLYHGIVTRKQNVGYYGREEEFRAQFARVYTSDNSPVATTAYSTHGSHAIMVGLVQDNNEPDIKDYHIALKRAKGVIDKKLIGERDSDKLEHPILFEYSDGTLEINGTAAELGADERFPDFNRDCLTEWEFQIELPDGRTSEHTYRY